jgi:hypothetical protein
MLTSCLEGWLIEEITCLLTPHWSRDSSVHITTRYGVEGPGIESRCARDFSAPVQTGSETHPASYTMGTGFLPVVKRPGHGVDHHPIYRPLWGVFSAASSYLAYWDIIPYFEAQAVLHSSQKSKIGLRLTTYQSIQCVRSTILLRFILILSLHISLFHLWYFPLKGKHMPLSCFMFRTHISSLVLLYLAHITVLSGLCIPTKCCGKWFRRVFDHTHRSLDLLAVEASWNVMAHAQKPDFVFRRKGRVHLNRRGRQFSRLLAAEVCASAVVMLDAPCSEVVWRVPTIFRHMRFFGILPSGEWKFHTDVSGQPIVQGTVLPLKLRPLCCPETSVWNYNYLLRKTAEERRSHLNRGENPKLLACPSESLVPNYRVSRCHNAVWTLIATWLWALRLSYSYNLIEWYSITDRKCILLQDISTLWRR